MPYHPAILWFEKSSWNWQNLQFLCNPEEYKITRRDKPSLIESGSSKISLSK